MTADNSKIGVKVALTLPESGQMTRQHSIDLVRLAEDLSYDSVWESESWGSDVFTNLTQLACVTTRIKIGAGIATVYSRTPGMMAQTVGNLDIISQGRFLLGLGTSGPVVVENWHGQPFSKPLRRLREYVEIIRLALTGANVDYDGEIFHLKGFRLRFTPLRQDIPILIASLGPKNLHLTGELCDGWIPIFPHADKIKGLLAHIQIGADVSGKSLEDFEVAPYVLAAISDRGHDVRELARAHIAFYIAGMGNFYRNLIASYGFVEEVNRVVSLWNEKRDEARSEAIAVVTEEMIDSLTLAGSRQSVLGRLERLRDAGVTLPILSFPNGSSRSVVEDTLKTLAPARA